jgi:hypothetical protein
MHGPAVSRVRSWRARSEITVGVTVSSLHPTAPGFSLPAWRRNYLAKAAVRWHVGSGGLQVQIIFSISLIYVQFNLKKSNNY